MADTPKVGDRVLYRGRYREVVGWLEETDGSGRQLTDSRTPIIAYQNPETGRNTYNREADMMWSDHFGAWYPEGLLLSRAECVVYAALPQLPGGDVPQATQHERAARMLEDESLKLGDLSEADRERLDAKLAGYWPDEDARPSAADIFSEAREMRDHRQSVREA